MSKKHLGSSLVPNRKVKQSNIMFWFSQYLLHIIKDIESLLSHLAFLQALPKEDSFSACISQKIGLSCSSM